MKKIAKSLIIPSVVVTGVVANPTLVYGSPASVMGQDAAREVYRQSRQLQRTYSLNKIDISGLKEIEFHQAADVWNLLEYDRQKRRNFVSDPKGFFLSTGIEITNILNEDQIELLKAYYSDDIRNYIESGRYDLFLNELIQSGLLDRLDSGEYKTQIANLVDRNKVTVKQMIDYAIEQEIHSLSLPEFVADFLKNNLESNLYVAADPAAMVMTDIVAMTNVAVAVSVSVVGHGGSTIGSCGGGCHANTIFHDLYYSSGVALALNSQEFGIEINKEYLQLMKTINSVAESYVDYFVQNTDRETSQLERDSMVNVIKRVALMGIV